MFVLLLVAMIVKDDLVEEICELVIAVMRSCIDTDT
jgi:hypothetical protein